MSEFGMFFSIFTEPYTIIVGLLLVIITVMSIILVYWKRKILFSVFIYMILNVIAIMSPLFSTKFFTPSDEMMDLYGEGAIYRMQSLALLAVLSFELILIIIFSIIVKKFPLKNDD